MADLHFTIQISASRAKVWSAMLDDATYREWTGIFMPGSYYKGDWSESSQMLFLGPAEEGEQEGGMLAKVEENRPQELMALEYLAEIKNGVEIPWDGAGSKEIYRFEDVDGGTKLSIDVLTLPEQYAEMFEGMWPKSLETLKQIAERK